MLSIYRLPNHLKDEKVIKVVRRDIFILVKRIAFSIILIIMPIFLIAIMFYSFPRLTTGQLSYPLLILSVSAYYLFMWLFFFFSFIDYYLDVWLITNERIIDVQQRGFFSRIISEQRLYRIQDVTSEVHGVLPTIFKYGDVHIQTAGTRQRFWFHEVPYPEKIRNTIIKLAEMSKAKHRNEAHKEQGQKLQEALEQKL
jgi:hypothetical protein